MRKIRLLSLAMMAAMAAMCISCEENSDDENGEDIENLGAIERITIDASLMVYSPDLNDGEPQMMPYAGVIMLAKDNIFKMTKKGKGLHIEGVGEVQKTSSAGLTTKNSECWVKIDIDNINGIPSGKSTVTHLEAGWYVVADYVGDEVTNDIVIEAENLPAGSGSSYSVWENTQGNGLEINHLYCRYKYINQVYSKYDIDCAFTLYDNPSNRIAVYIVWE